MSGRENLCGSGGRVSRVWGWAGLLLSAALGVGCNLMSVPFFLGGMDAKVEPKCKLAAADGKQTIKVIVMASNGLETRPEFIRVDRELSYMLIKHLEKGFADNKQKVTFLPLTQLDKFKDRHPEWHTMSLKEIGSQFPDCDYVINLEIREISLYEKDSANALFHGRAQVMIDVAAIKAKDDTLIYHEPFACEYPRKMGSIPVDDGSINGNSAQFRQKFLNVIAKEMSWLFVSHPQDNELDLQ